MKIKNFFNFILIFLFSLILFYISFINYTQNKYIKNVTNYYYYIENNINNINKAIGVYQSPEILDIIISSLDTYFYINETFIKDHNFKNLDEVLEWQKINFDRANFSIHIEIYKSAMNLEKNRKNLEILINRIK